MTRIETERLAIRNFDGDDWRDLQEFIARYEASEYAQYDQGPWPTSAEEIKSITKWFAEGDSYLAVCLRTTGKLIGFICLKEGESADLLEYNLGYVLDSHYHGKGYATEGCRAVIGHAFGQLSADRVISSTAAVNHRSCRLLRRLGLKETGRSTASLRKTQEGKPIEFVAVSFAISRDEWLALRQASDHIGG